jgi:hypothetical protein
VTLDALTIEERLRAIEQRVAVLACLFRHAAAGTEDPVFSRQACSGAERLLEEVETHLEALQTLPFEITSRLVEGDPA